MLNRRSFTLLGAAALATPVILKADVFASEKRVRRNASTMSPADPFFNEYSQAVEAMHSLPDSDNRNWSNQAKLHLMFCPHGRLGFASWHRVYLDRFEAICSELIGKPDFALAYWDWTAIDGRIPDPFYDMDSLTNEKWDDDGSAIGTVGVRDLARGAGLQSDPRLGGAFLQRNIESISRERTFNRLWRRLEGSPHNNAHLILGASGGHMGHMLSPLDPLFWLHHCNVDKLWAEWQAANNTVPQLNLVFEQMFSNEDGSVGNFQADDYVNLASLNYSYDTISATLNAEAIVAQTTNFENLAVAAGDTGEKIIGSATNEFSSSADIETRLNVPVEGLLRELFSSRVFRANPAFQNSGAAVEPRRILARLKNIERGPKSNSLLANVFVNCPYLSPETPIQDQHFAGSFSFFGPMATCSTDCDFVVDISSALRQQVEDGRTEVESVDVQIMPVSLTGVSEVTDTAFKIGSVELISA